MRWTFLIGLSIFSFSAFSLRAQLPADAIDLGKVKIAEKFKAAGAEDAKAKLDRYIKNYIAAMSTVWCPVTDQLTPGGMQQWTKEGVTWESCCAFCDDTVKDEDFPKALERLTERAKKSFELTGGKYTEGAKSPIEGALKADATSAKPAPSGGGEKGNAKPDEEPAWLKGQALKPTYHEGIGLIFEHRCLECHHPGAVAPMSFMSLPEIKKWSKSLKSSVANREMPPWPADPTVGAFATNRILTQKEMDLIVQWAGAGFPEGTGNYKAPTPEGDGNPETPGVVPAGAKAVKVANADFKLPAGAENVEVKASYELKEDAKLATLQPIMNLRGKEIAVSAKLPNGTKKDLLKISHWDADWKIRYQLKEPLVAPKGTVVEIVAHYDNSKLNAKNPDASVEVKSGPNGEALECWLGFLP